MNELKLNLTAEFEAGMKKQSYEIVDLLVDSIGAIYAAVSTLVATGGSTISFQDLGDGGTVIIKNLDETNFVTFQPGSGGDPFIKILPGEFCLFRNADTVYGIADTADVTVEIFVVAP